MPARDHTFAAALVASILAHAAIVFVIADDAVRGSRATDDTVAPRPTEVAYAPPEQPSETLFGDAKGTGDAANARRGELPMLATKDASQTQAFLSRDPVGPGPIFRDAPSMSVLPTGLSPRASVPVAPPPSPPPEPVGFGATRKLPAPHVTRTAARTVPPAPGADKLGAVGVPQPAADPAVMSDSESDPFASSATFDNEVEFRDGRVEARLGRKVKTIRPNLSLASQFDLMGMKSPRMLVRLNVRADGSVRKVDILSSSRSASVDQEVKVALYQWWFEPAKDDVVTFPILWK
jgi:TonB family protein